MSDPLSVIASVAGLIQISAKIISITTQLSTSIKDAPASICRIKDEMGQLNLVFRQVQRLIEGFEKKGLKRHRLSMLPLHDLMTVLTGCVLAYSALDKTLSKVAGLDETDPENPVPQTPAPSYAGSFLMRVKWALWKESEAVEIIATIERHKSSLNIMLSIIQSEASAADAENLDRLRDLVEKISDKIAETHNETSIQLRELISRHHDGSDIPACAPPPLPPASGNYDNNNTVSTTDTASSIATPSSESAVDPDFDDRASIRTTATTISIRSIRSFTQELKNSRAYKRLERSKLRRGTNGDSHSYLSKDSRESKGDRWSMLSDLSLGDLSISEISVLELPIDISELYDPIPYRIHDPQVDSGKTRPGIRWSSRGRLHQATRRNNGFVMKTLLNLGADIEEMDGEGRTALSYAADGNHLEACKILLERDANVNSIDHIGRSPLSYAVNHPEICRILLDRGANVDLIDHIGRSPLSFAADGNHFEACKILVDQGGATIDSSDASGRTPLSYAAGSSGSKYTNDICQLLLDKGARVNSVDNTGRSPVSYAANRNHLEACKILLERIDQSGQTQLLFHASAACDYNLCKVLVEQGSATVDSRDASGRTPLSYAAGSSGKYTNDICQLLLDKGATVNSVDNTGRSPLSYAAGSSNASGLGIGYVICKLLLDKGATVNSVDVSGKTPLDYVNRKERDPTYRLLVEKGTMKGSKLQK